MNGCAFGTRMISNDRPSSSAHGLVVGDEHDLPPARRHLLHVRHRLVEEVVARRDHDDRDVLIDQRDRSVLELARRIALGVDVGDFLELQRPFERDRIIDPAPEIENVARACATSRATSAMCFSVFRISFMCRGTSISAPISSALLLRAEMAPGLGGGDGERRRAR